VRLWRQVAGTPATLRGPTACVWGSSEVRHLTGRCGVDGQTLWRRSSGQPFHPPPPMQATRRVLMACAFSADGRSSLAAAGVTHLRTVGGRERSARHDFAGPPCGVVLPVAFRETSASCQAARI